MEEFLNKKYKLVQWDEHYDAYLEALGLNFFNRKIAKSIPSSTQLVKLSENEYSLNTSIPFKTLEQRFVPGQECEASTLDGRNIKNIFTIEGNKLIERQIQPEREVIVVRTFFEKEILGEDRIGNIKCKNRSEVID